MTKIETLESAYQELANACIDFIHGRSWETVSCQASIFTTMANTKIFLTSQGRIDGDGVDWPDTSISPGGAALFLRDELMKRTGERIWGLTFMLFPDGKFKVDYDYSKPEGYEETNETISGDEINASMGQFFSKGKE